MQRLVLGAICAAISCAPVAAAEPVRVNVSAFQPQTTITRTFTISPAAWPGVCSGRPTCVITDPFYAGVSGIFDFTTSDGITYSTSGTQTYQGPAFVDNKIYDYSSVLNYTITLQRGSNGELQGTGFAFTANVTSSAYTAIVTPGTTRPRFGFLSELPAVPEPSTWAMLILGFGLIGAAMRPRSMSYVDGAAAHVRHGGIAFQWAVRRRYQTLAERGASFRPSALTRGHCAIEKPVVAVHLMCAAFRAIRALR